jgi:hypothetical protein
MRMGMYHNIPREEAETSTADSTRLTQSLKLVAEDETGCILTDEAIIDFLSLETGQKINDFLLRLNAEVNVALTLSLIGLDSFTPIELRRWFRKAFGLQISVLEIMGSGSLRHLGGTVAGKLSENMAA